MVKKVIIFINLLLLFSSSITLFSLEPPLPGEFERYKKDGTFEERLQFAKELGNYKVSPYLMAKLHSKLSGRCEMAPPIAWQGMPTKGNVKIFALLIAFQDYPFNTDKDLVYKRLFEDGTSNPPYESLRNFYKRASYGKLEIGGNVLGWYTTPYPRSQVSESTGGREKLIKEALNYFESQGTDFSQFDNDGDGEIDYFIVVWTGPDTGWANFWWGYQTYFYDSSYKLDGKKLGNYSWQWEANPPSGQFSPRVVIHETGHALGLPDYYDYDDTMGPKGGVGGLDQMDGNWGDHNCFSKMLLEWIDPEVVNQNSEITLKLSSESGDSVIVMPEAEKADQFEEYYMVQYRDRSQNDATYPNDGLLIWHIDARTSSSGYDFVYDNSYSEHKLLRLMEADGLEEIEQNRVADAGDYYIEGSSISDSTFPSSSRYCGEKGGFEINSLVKNDTTFSFNVTFKGVNPQITSVSKLKNPFRIAISGTNIQEGAKVVIGVDSFVWQYTEFSNGSIILDKGNKLKRKFPLKTTTPILVINPDGSATKTSFTR